MASEAPRAAQAGIDFGRAFTFVREDPEWIKKLLIGGAFGLACALLVGIPFVLGYFARTLRNVAAGSGPAPLPEWDDLGGLFEEGLRLTAVYLVYALGALVVFGVLFAVLLLPAIATSGAGRAADAIGALSALGMLALYAIVMLVSLALAIYVPASLARTALRGSIGDGLAWRDNVEFIRANLANYALSLVGYLLASFVSQLGLLLCCVGIFPAAFWSYLVLAHALGQTARLSPLRV
jgi:hypothetical protein